MPCSIHMVNINRQKIELVCDITREEMNKKKSKKIILFSVLKYAKIVQKIREITFSPKFRLKTNLFFANLLYYFSHFLAHLEYITKLFYNRAAAVFNVLLKKLKIAWVVYSSEQELPKFGYILDPLLSKVFLMRQYLHHPSISYYQNVKNNFFWCVWCDLCEIFREINFTKKNWPPPYWRFFKRKQKTSAK